LKGTYKVGSFVHTGNFDTWNSQAQAALGTGSLKSGGIDYGIYGVVDQELIQSGGRGVEMFVRGGGAPGDINFINWYVDGGFNFRGSFPAESGTSLELRLRIHPSVEISAMLKFCRVIQASVARLC
jgi:porin